MCMILQGKKSKFNRLTYSYTCINQVLSWILLEKKSIFVTRWLRNHFCLIRWVTDLCPMSYKTVQFGFYPSTGINAFYRFLKNRIDKGREKYFRITLDHNSFELFEKKSKAYRFSSEFPILCHSTITSGRSLNI